MSFIKKASGGGEYYYSDLLGCPHAFSTRAGGVSVLPHLATMNLGENRGDDPENVRENYRRILSYAGLPGRYVYAKQVHSTNVIEVRKAEAEGAEAPEGDGFVTKERGITLCVKTADCIPILLYDPEAEVIAALHAGWRGSAANIVRSGVIAMEKSGAKAERIRAAIGAGIGKCCFEVKDDFVEEFTGYLGKEAAERYLERREGKIFADLKKLNYEMLSAAGVREENIDVSPHCTCCDPQTFFSHRASGGKRGTMGALIALPEK